MDMWDGAAVRARLREKAARDPGRRCRGAQNHRYALAPPLPEAEIRSPRPQAADDRAVDGEWEDDRRPGRLAAPFPFTEPEPGPLGSHAEEWTRATLTVAEQGCGMYSRLILNGPHAGEVWGLDPDWGGFGPESPGFHNWYTAWLERT